jgi:3-phosphoglycerate kinase
MSEEAVAVENEIEANPVGDMIDHIAGQNFNKAKDVFDELLRAKMSAAFDAEKLAVANTVFNKIEDEEDLDDDEDLEYEFEEEDLEEIDLDDEEESEEK